MRFLVFIRFLMMTVSHSAVGQFIRGTIFDKSHQPIGDVHVQVKDLELTTVSGSDGSFKFNLTEKAGASNEVTLIASLIGYEATEAFTDFDMRLEGVYFTFRYAIKLEEGLRELE